MRSIRLVFVSTNALTRNGITQMVVHSDPPIDVVGVFADFQAAHQYLDDHPVDVLLIDEALPRHTDLLQEVKSLCLQHIGVAVVVILPRPTLSLVQQLLKHRVRGILYKQDDLEYCLVQAIIWGKQRGIHLSPGVSHLIDSQRTLPVALTQRDYDVLKLLADGLEPKEIALQIGVGSNTVYRILWTLRDLFSAQNNAHLITITLQSKLLDSGGVD
jgi:DNA-binding NarL/FixJ family response regulator